jgi:hypothetical protein
VVEIVVLLAEGNKISVCTIIEISIKSSRRQSVCYYVCQWDLILKRQTVMRHTDIIIIEKSERVTVVIRSLDAVESKN